MTKILWTTETRGQLAIDDCLVPNIQVVKHIQPKDDGLLALELDSRYSIDLTEEELEKWGWWVANAMAVSAGYSCHGEHCVQLNPHKRKVRQITSCD